MAKLIKKWIALNAVDGTKILLSNDEFLRARNVADSADINMFKVNASDKIEAGAELDMGSNAISNVGTVDGVNISTLKTDFDGHVDGTASKHDASEIDVEAGDGVNHSAADLETVVGELDDALELRAKSADLASTDNGKGASLVAVRDVAANFTASDVEAVLAEIQANINSSQAGINMKDNVVVASTANVTIATAPAAIDGVTLSNGDRVLLKDQTDPIENGVYDFNGSGSAMTRSEDFDGNPTGEVKGGNLVFADQGTANAKTQFIITGTEDKVVDTDAINFTIFSRAEAIVAGDGLSESGLTLSVNAASISGAGLADDGSNNLKIADSAAGTGIQLNAGVLSLDFTEFDTDDLVEGLKKFVSQAQKDKIDLITITQAVDLDTMESDLSGHLDGGASKHDLSEVDNETDGNYIASGSAQTALDALDTQVKSNADAIAGSSAPAKESITLDATDISNGFVDLTAVAVSTASVMVTPVGGPEQDEGVDYTVSLAGGAGGNTRVTFAGDLASELEDGDKIIIRYSA